MSATVSGSRKRRACRVLGQHRSTQRRIPRGRDDEERLVADMIELARQYGRYGYRRIAALLRDAGWQVNDKRVERLWRREGLKVPEKQPKRGRLWLNDGSCIRAARRAGGPWSGPTTSCITGPMTAGPSACSMSWTSSPARGLSIRVRRKLSSIDVIDVLTDLFILRGIPAWIRSDNGPEFRSPTLYGDGLPRSAPGLHSSSRAHPGRTAISRVSTPGCATSS